MAKSKHTDAQIVQILREAEIKSLSITELCRKHGIAQTTFFRWKNRFGGLQESDTKRLRLLEQENARLKKLLAERDLEVEILKEVNAKKW